MNPDEDEISQTSSNSNDGTPSRKRRKKALPPPLVINSSGVSGAPAGLQSPTGLGSPTLLRAPTSGLPSPTSRFPVPPRCASPSINFQPFGGPPIQIQVQQQPQPQPQPQQPQLQPQQSAPPMQIAPPSGHHTEATSTTAPNSKFNFSTLLLCIASAAETHIPASASTTASAHSTNR